VWKRDIIERQKDRKGQREDTYRNENEEQDSVRVKRNGCIDLKDFRIERHADVERKDKKWKRKKCDENWKG